MTRMHNPPHPGEVLREYLGRITVTEAALKLGVNRVTLSRLAAGAAGVSSIMPLKELPDAAFLGSAFDAPRVPDILPEPSIFIFT